MKKADLNKILRSHDHQLKVRDDFKNIMSNSHMVMMNVLDGPIEGYDIVIVLGGDDSFKYVSHYVKDIPLLGVNSDPDNSEGYLTRWQVRSLKDVIDLIEQLDFNEYSIEKWTRLQATVNDEVIQSATSEYFLGKNRRLSMSRHVLVYRGKEYEQKCSGIIVATGAGSTGWLDSAAGMANIDTWDPTLNEAGFVITEGYKVGETWDEGHRWGVIGPDEEIILHSLNNNDGIIGVDSWEEFDFNRGTETRISLGEPLHIIVPDTVPIIGAAS